MSLDKQMEIIINSSNAQEVSECFANYLKLLLLQQKNDQSVKIKLVVLLLNVG